MPVIFAVVHNSLGTGFLGVLYGEEQIARGEAPDLNEAFSPESLAYLAG